jgi:hypothetical protein
MEAIAARVGDKALHDRANHLPGLYVSRSLAGPQQGNSERLAKD